MCSVFEVVLLKFTSVLSYLHPFTVVLTGLVVVKLALGVPT